MGLFGVYGAKKAASVIYYGLHGLQHRGQMGAGIATFNDKGQCRCHRGLGLAGEVFNAEASEAKHDAIPPMIAAAIIASVFLPFFFMPRIIPHFAFFVLRDSDFLFLSISGFRFRFRSPLPFFALHSASRFASSSRLRSAHSLFCTECKIDLNSFTDVTPAAASFMR